MMENTRATYIIALALFTCSFLLQWHYGYSWADEGQLWYISQRTNAGDVPIRDFFSYDPGRYYWSAFFFRILGNDSFLAQLIANASFGLIGLLTAVAALSTTKLRIRHKLSAIMLLVLMLGYPRHKIYEQSLSLISAAGICWVLIQPQLAKRWFLYGALSGLAAIFGRNAGLFFIVAAIAAVIISRPNIRRSSLALGAGIAIGYTPMLALFATQSGLWAAFMESILFTPNWQLPLPITFPWNLQLIGILPIDALQTTSVSLLCVMVPLLYIGTIAWLYYNGQQGIPLVWGPWAAGVPFLYQAFTRADFGHIAQGIIPVVLLLAGLIYLVPMRFMKFVAAGFALLILASWLPMQPAFQLTRQEMLYPGSTIHVDIDGYDFTVLTSQHDSIFRIRYAYGNCRSLMASPYYPGFYSLLHMKAPVKDIYNLFSRAESFQKEEILRLEHEHVSLILLNDIAAIDGNTSFKFKNTNSLINDYITTHFNRVGEKLPDGGELWARGDCAEKLKVQ